MKRALVLTAAVMGLIGSPAMAQDVWGWSIIIPSVTGTDQLGTALRNREAAATSTPPAQRASPPPASKPDAASLRFNASAERRRVNIDRFLATRRGGDAATQRQLESLLRDPGLMPAVDRQLSRYGLRSDNMADLYAIWWIGLWQASRGDVSDPTPAAARAVKAQSENAFLTIPGLTGADDATKQAFGEGLMIQALLIGTATEGAARDPAQARRRQACP